MNIPLRAAALLIAALIAALIVPLIAPLGGAAAQDGGGLSAEDQALIERLQAAVRATEDYPGGVVHVAMTSRHDAEIIFSAAETFPSATVETRESDHRFTRDAAGRPNSLTTGTLDYSAQTATGVIIAYQLEYELRQVGGALYVQATRTAEDEAGLDPLPDGWLRVDSETGAVWPALRYLPLSDSLREIDQLSVIDPDVVLVLAYSSRVETLDAADLDGAGAAEVVRATSTGADLTAALIALALQLGQGDQTEYYALISPDSDWETTCYLDSDGRLVRVTMESRVELFDVDLALLSPGAPAGSRFNSRQEFAVDYAITLFDAPPDPVEAPEIAAPE